MAATSSTSNKNIAMEKCDTVLKAVMEMQLFITENDDVIPLIYAKLAGPVCRLAKTLEPNICKKVDEVIFAYENGIADSASKLTVNSEQHGADLYTPNGGAVELKTAVWTKTSKRANINWGLPSSKKLSESERRKVLLASVKEKTLGGGCECVIKNAHGKVIASYFMTHRFMMGYFKRIPFKVGLEKIYLSISPFSDEQ